jgi:hypothetical protein
MSIFFFAYSMTAFLFSQCKTASSFLGYKPCMFICITFCINYMTLISPCLCSFNKKLCSHFDYLLLCLVQYSHKNFCI